MRVVEITFRRLLRIWWALLWRNVVATACCMVAGGGVGFVVGYFLGSMGVPTGVIQILWGALGAILGFTCTFVPVWWVLGKDFGEFRLVLVAKDGGDPSPLPAPPARS